MTWHNADYAFRKEITVQSTNIDSDLSNFPVLIWIEADTDLNTTGAKVQADLDDIRFYDLDGNALKYECVRADADGTDGHIRAYVKMNLYASPTGNQNKLYLYYGHAGAVNGEDAANVWTENFEAVWHLDDNGSQTDSTGNGHTLTGYNTPSYQQSAYVHQGILFNDAASEYLESDAAPLTSAPATLTALFNSNDDTIFQVPACVVAKNSATDYFALLLAPNNDVAFSSRSSGGAPQADATTNYSASTWHHVAGVENSASNRSVFLDGGGKGTDATSSTPSGLDRVSVGRVGDSTPSAYFSGLLEEVRIASVARSDAWIKFEANNFLEADHEITIGSEEQPIETFLLYQFSSPVEPVPHPARIFKQRLAWHAEPVLVPGFNVYKRFIKPVNPPPHPGAITGPRLARHTGFESIQFSAGVHRFSIPVNPPPFLGLVTGPRLAWHFKPGDSFLVYRRDVRPIIPFQDIYPGRVWRGLARPPEWIEITQTFRQFFSVADNSLEQYELYRGVDTDIDFEAAPWEAFTTLPHDTATLGVDADYKFTLRKRNKYNLLSRNITAEQIIVDAGGQQEAVKPAAPEYAVAAAAAGKVLITAEYNYPADGVNQADQWLIYLTSNGVDPVPGTDTPVIVTMAKSDGLAKLKYTSAVFSQGAVIKVIVRTRRSSVTADSQNTTVVSATATLLGPDEPDGGIFY